jgi:hypothetical protein
MQSNHEVAAQSFSRSSVRLKSRWVGAPCVGRNVTACVIFMHMRRHHRRRHRDFKSLSTTLRMREQFSIRVKSETSRT